MRLKFTFTLLFITLLISPPSHAKPAKPGRWLGELQLNEKVKLPFIFEVFSKDSIVLINAQERLTMNFILQKDDTSIYTFPDFDSELHIHWKKNKASGYWLNFNKSSSYIIPLTAIRTEKEQFHRFKTNETTITLKEKWRTVFEPETDGSGTAAIGLFHQEYNALGGTFLTETGDYRYLSGNIYGNRLYLSCFDGSHAFVFQAELQADTLKGSFHSGKTYQTTWWAVQDEKYELSDPYGLTYIDDSSQKINFSFPTVDGKNFDYPNNEMDQQVTIIQIMGSWCPNCIDETKFYANLYEEFKDRGLQIIMVGYEIDKDSSLYAAKLKRVQQKYNIQYPILVAGSANKQRSSNDFPMLNKIISYPTSIFIDRSGNIVKIHTGFYGPGTGSYYTDYVKETKALLERLLQ